MFEVIDNMELPEKQDRQRYPVLENGQGFIISSTDAAGRKSLHSAIAASYRSRGQRVTVRKDADGNFHVKRIA